MQAINTYFDSLAYAIGWIVIASVMFILAIYAIWWVSICMSKALDYVIDFNVQDGYKPSLDAWGRQSRTLQVNNEKPKAVETTPKAAQTHRYSKPVAPAEGDEESDGCTK